MKIWTKRAAGVGAIIAGLLVAGSVAANAADLPVVGNLPLLGGQQQAAPAVPANMTVPGMQTSKATPKHEVRTQRATVNGKARPTAYGHDGENGDGSNSVVVGDASGNKTLTKTGDVNVNAPVNVCGNPVNAPLGIAAAAECDNDQDNITVHREDESDGTSNSVVIGSGSGLDTETLVGDANTNAPTNTCGNPLSDGGLLTGSACKNSQRNLNIHDEG